MKNVLKLFIVLSAALAAGCSAATKLGIPEMLIPSNYAKSPAFDLKPVWRLAVLPATGRTTSIGQAANLSDYAGMALLRTGRFSVVDRTAVDQILREQEFSYSGVVDQATAVSLGRLLGAEAVMMITVAGITHDDFWSDMPEQREAELYVKIISVETSEVLYSAVGQGSDFNGAEGALRSAMETALWGINR
mgnify:CR=1 FL=1